MGTMNIASVFREENIKKTIVKMKTDGLSDVIKNNHYFRSSDASVEKAQKARLIFLF